MTELLEKETEYLTPQSRATAILYSNATPKFATNHDLAEYSQLVDNKYAKETLITEQPVLQQYAEPVILPQPPMDRYASPSITEIPQKTAEFKNYYNPQMPIFSPRRPTPVEEIATTTVEEPRQIVEEKLDDDIADDNVEYVVKLKNTAIISVACVAVVLVLLSVLFIVNAINIAKANVELRQLESTQNATNTEYENALVNATEAKANAIRQLESGLAQGEYDALPVGSLPTNYDKYKKPVDLESSTSAFDIICEFLSKIF
jgi:hypothetical protein